MKYLCFMGLFAAVVLCAQVKSPADRPITDPESLSSRSNPDSGPIPIDDLFYTRNVVGPAWSPDGREIVFTTNLSGRLNLWKVAAEGGWPVQLSQSDDREVGAAWSPDGKWIVYQQDFGGGEYFDLLAIPAGGGPAVNLTNTRDVSETGALWSPDGASIALETKPRTSSTSDIAEMDWQTRTIRQLTREQTADYSWGAVAWSSDGRYILAVRYNVGATDESVYRIEAATGEMEELTPHSGEILYEVSSISPDGETALISSNEKYGVRNVALLDIPTRKLTWVTDLEWDAYPGDFSPDGDRFTYGVNEDGRTSIYLVERSSMQTEQIDFPPGISQFAGRPAFSPSGDSLLIAHQDSQRPSNLWVYDLGSGESRQLTVSALASLDPERLPPSQLVHYRSFDGKIVSAFLWLPDNLQRDGSNAGIVLPPGGPTG